MIRGYGFAVASVALCTLSMPGGCTDTRTGFDLAVFFDGGLKIDQFRIETRAEGIGETMVAPLEPLLRPSGARTLVLIDDGWAAKPVQITVTGLFAAGAVAHGSAEAQTPLGEVTATAVTLVQGCEKACAVGTRECGGDGIRHCELDESGCPRWSSSACPATAPQCIDGHCSASCRDECPANGRRCADQGYQTCGQYDGDPCKEWSETVECPSGEQCSKDGRCEPFCDGGPCQCRSGETLACDDMGACKGGKRQCVDGRFGPCSWSVGPKKETCNGVDDDCNGLVDDGLLAQRCALQQGVCDGSTSRCGGSAGWLPCTAADYSAFAKSIGKTYEARETRCDKVDNDCDGEVDEPADCSPVFCGDGVCNGNETTTSCSKDCPTCTLDVCVDSETVAICENGAAKHYDCGALCAQEGGLLSAGCRVTDDGSHYSCFCKEPLFKVCNNEFQCPAHEWCLKRDKPAMAQGHCARSCHVNGDCKAIEDCVERAGRKLCQQTCNFLSRCPAGMECSAIALGGYCYIK